VAELEKGKQRKVALLAALDECLRERPLGEINITQIAQRAGVARSGFYFYFPTKEAAVGALFEDVAAQMSADGLAAVAEEGLSQRERAARLLESTVKHWRAHATLFVALFDAVGSDADARATLDRAVSGFVDIGAAFIEEERGAELADAAFDARALASLLLGMNVSAAERDVRAIVAGEPPDKSLVPALTEVWYRILFGT